MPRGFPRGPFATAFMASPGVCRIAKLVTVLEEASVFLRYTRGRMEIAILIHDMSGKTEQNLMRERVLLRPKGCSLVKCQKNGAIYKKLYSRL